VKKQQITSVTSHARICDRLTFLRVERKFTLADIAEIFGVNKSTVLRWESLLYWKNHDTPNKRLLLMQLAELYQIDSEWILKGKRKQDDDIRNILIIDDDNTSLTIMSMIIRSCLSSKYRLYCFTQPDMALLWARDNSSALVFSDYRMPDMNGDELITQLKKLGRYASTPIVVITQIREPGVADKVSIAGASHVLQKPISKEKLQDVLRPYNRYL